MSGSMARQAVTIMAAVGILAACGGSGSAPSSTTLVEVGLVTVTESGCAYERSADPVAGTQGAIRLADKRGVGFNAHLFLLDDGYSFAEWEAGFLVSHATLLQHSHRVADGHVDPSKTDRFTAKFVRGTYGILCVPLQNGEEYGVGYTAGPIRAI